MGCATDLRPRWQVFVRGKVSFAAKFLDLDEALIACIRAKAAGYDAKMISIPR